MIVIMGDEFNYFVFHGVQTHTELSKGVTITIVRNDDEFIIYNNFEKIGEIDFDKNLIDDYRTEGLLLRLWVILKYLNTDIMVQLILIQCFL